MPCRLWASRRQSPGASWAGRRPERPAAFHKASPRRRSSIPCQKGRAGFPPPPRGQKAGQRLFLPLGEQVHRHGGSWGPRPGASSPESCMTQMPDSPYSANWISPFFPGQKAAALPQADSPPGPQAGQGFQHSGVPAAQRGQAGGKGALPCRRPAGPGRGRSLRCRTGGRHLPPGADHVLGRQELALAFPLCLDGVAAPFLAQLQHPAAGLHRHAQRLQPAQQQAGQIRRLVGIGIQPPCLIGPVEQAQPLPPGQAGPPRRWRPAARPARRGPQ